MTNITRRTFLTGMAGLAGSLMIPNWVFAKEYSKEELEKKLELLLDPLTRKVIELESHWRPWIQRRNTLDTGLMQIKPIVLKEWNNNKTKKYILKDLFNPYKNVMIGRWYLHDRIGGHYMPFYGLEETVENKLVCYKSGPTLIGKDLKIKNATEEFKRLPKDAKNYLRKYRKLVNS